MLKDFFLSFEHCCIAFCYNCLDLKWEKLYSKYRTLEFFKHGKVTQILKVSRNQLLYRIFVVNIWIWKHNIAGCCKETFFVQFSSKAKQNLFSFLSDLLSGHKNSSFFKRAVELSNSMKQNYEGFTFINQLVCKKQSQQVK